MGKALRDTPWPVLLLVASFLCPTELSVYAGSARLPPHRALLLVLLPFALARLAGRSAPTTRSFDVAFLAFATWTFVAYLLQHGAADGLQTAGAQSLDSFGSFLVARAYVRDARALRATAAVLFGAVLTAGLLALPEMLTGRFYVHDLMRQLTGRVHTTGVETRLGLTRAFGTFDHPIHLGTFCAAGFAFAIYSARIGGSVIRATVIPICTLAGLSSAPMLGIAVQSLLMALEKLTRGIKN
jgi:hypothetical protein